MLGFLRRLLRRNDRREYERFVASQVTPVFIGHSVPQQAEIIDLSVGGVALKYISSEGQIKDVFALDFQASDGFQMGKVLVQKIADRKNKASGNTFDRMLRGQFLNLSQAKAMKLETFLKNYQEKFGK